MTESGFVSVPGGSLYYEDEGDGPAVVLIHAGVANLRMWDPLVASLSARYRMIRYDTRGFGLTESEHAEFSNRADVIAVLDHAGVDKATVVGASRGGSIALDSVIEYPQRFEALVVVAGGVGGYRPPDIEEDEALWKEAERMEEAKEWDALADFETRFWCDGPGQPTDRVDPEIRDRVHGWIIDNYRADKEGGVPQVLTPSAVGRLGEVTVPVMVVIGEFDEPFANASCRYLAETVGATLVEYPAAHMLTLEHPDRFATDLHGFLARVHG